MGSRGGSTVLVSSKSGTNNFHGSLFEFFRNDYLDARNYFDPVKKGKYRRMEVAVLAHRSCNRLGG